MILVEIAVYGVLVCSLMIATVSLMFQFIIGFNSPGNSCVPLLVGATSAFIAFCSFMGLTEPEANGDSLGDLDTAVIVASGSVLLAIALLAAAIVLSLIFDKKGIVITYDDASDEDYIPPRGDDQEGYVPSDDYTLDAFLRSWE